MAKGKQEKKVVVDIKPKSKRAKKTKKGVKKAYGRVSHDFLKSMNPYLQTIEDPWKVQGVKVPDMITYPSATFSITDRRTVTSNTTSGMAMICYGIGATAANLGSVIPVTTNFFFGCTNNAALETTSDIFVGATSFTIPAWNSLASTVGSTFSSVRLVSASVSVCTQGTPNNTQGKISTAFFPKTKLDVERGGNPVSVDRIELEPGARILPCNTMKSVEVRYKPLDNQVLQYANLNAVTPNQTLEGQYYPGEWVFVASGLGATAVNLQAIAVFNYEAIPKTSQFSPITLSSSPSDPIAMSLALNEASEMTPTKITNTPPQMATNTQSDVKHVPAHPEQQRGGIFEKVMSVMPEIIEKGLPIAQQVLPLIANML